MKDSEQFKIFEEDRAPKIKVEEEFRIEKVKCEICFEIIGKCDMSKFSAPMTGNMFLPKDHKHGYGPPFILNEPWEDMKCPYCRHRPFLNPNFFLNEKGRACGYLHECEKCGAGFENRFALSGHKKHCKYIRRK
jgi:hypothetical protein